MPTRKQRRRREKLQRHEWEEVYVDEEGRELDPDEAEELLEPAGAGGRVVKTRKGETRKPDPRANRRPIEPPSLRRTLRRGLLFFPLMLIVVFLLAGDEITTAQKITQTIVLLAFFLPFSYFMDAFLWRTHQRRLAKHADSAKKR